MLVKNGVLVKGRKFKNDRVVGSVMQAVNVYNRREMDEIMLLFLDGLDFDLVERVADRNFIPLTVGGGVRSLDAARRLLACGADKIALSSLCETDPGEVRNIAEAVGSQSVTCVLNDPDPEDIEHAVSIGAGEVVIQCKELDGEMNGFNLGSLHSANDHRIPVVASSGAGVPDHFLAPFAAGADAVAAASIWHFTQYTPREVKECLSKQGIPVRLT